MLWRRLGFSDGLLEIGFRGGAAAKMAARCWLYGGGGKWYSGSRESHFTIIRKEQS